MLRRDVIRYSVLRASKGSMDAARYAGIEEARMATIKIEKTAISMTIGSKVSTSKSNERRRRVTKIAATNPMPQPANPSLAPELRMRRITLDRVEPSAMRMAISWGRKAQEKAM